MNNIINALADLKSFRYIPEGTDFFDENGIEWKQVPEWTDMQDRYLVSDAGDTYSIKWHSIMHNSPNGKDGTGYIYANFMKNGIPLRIPVSRLVALSYSDEVPDNWRELDVNHLDENPQNNHISNLQWCTHADNCNYGHHNERLAASNSGRKATPEQRERAREAHLGKGVKAVQQLDTAGNVIADYPSLVAASDATGLDSGNISSCCRGKRPTVGGFIFRYKVSEN